MKKSSSSLHKSCLVDPDSSASLECSCLCGLRPGAFTSSISICILGFLAVSSASHRNMFINNIFGEIPEKSVVFVIDTSGSMYDMLAAVKDHIAETLIDRAYNRPGTTFNIIEFSSEVFQV